MSSTATTCTDCDVGYISTAGATACTKCATGTTTEDADRTACGEWNLVDKTSITFLNGKSTIRGVDFQIIEMVIPR